MGGSIAIAARFADGTAVCVDGWTNFMPTMIVNATTLSGDDHVVRRTLVEVARMPEYGGPGDLEPHGYGLVVVDFVARRIHSMQDYTSFGSRMINQLLDLRKTGWDGDVYRNVLSEEAEGLLDAGRVAIIARNAKRQAPETIDRARVVDLMDEDIRTFMSGGRREHVFLAIDLKPFELIEYERNGFTAMRAALETDGFPLAREAGLNASI